MRRLLAQSRGPPGRERSSVGEPGRRPPSSPGPARRPLPRERKGFPGDPRPPSAPGPDVPVPVGSSPPRRAREDETPGGSQQPHPQ